MKAIIFIILLVAQSSVFAVGEDKWDEYIGQAAAATGMDRDFIKSIIKQESGFRDDVGNGTTLSSAGAIGAMQIMPATGADLGYSVEDLKDPQTNIMAGAEYLKWLSERSYINGDPLLMAAAYNAGPGAVQQYGGVPPYSETVPYVQNVAQNYANYSGNSIDTSSVPAPTLDGGTPSISIALANPSVLTDISTALQSFEQLTGTSITYINGFFKGLLVFLMMLLVGIQVLFFWKEGVSQHDETVLMGTFLFSMRSLLLMSIFFLLITTF